MFFKCKFLQYQRKGFSQQKPILLKKMEAKVRKCSDGMILKLKYILCHDIQGLGNRPTATII